MKLVNFRLKDVSENLPGIFFAVVLILTLVLPQMITSTAPRYYAGDPNFDVKQYRQQALDNWQRRGFLYPGEIDESHIVLPPKVVGRKTLSLLGFVTFFGFAWGLSWSVYAYLNRQSFKSKRIVWITFLGYLIYHAAFAMILAVGGRGLG